MCQRIILVARIVTIVAGVAVVLAGFTAASAGTGPAATVTPATGLRDLQAVEVSGTGFPANASVPITQCVLGPGGTAAGICYGATRITVTADAGGAFTTSFIVRRVIVEAGSSKDCADAPGACGLNVGTQPVVASPPLEFDPAVPPNGPAVQVDPSTGLVDGATVRVTGTGFTPNQQLKIALCRAGGFGFEGCDLATQVMAMSDANGAFGLDFVVRAAIVAGGTNGGALDCTAPPGCAIVAANNFSASEFGNAPLTFAAVVDDELPRTGAATSNLAVLGAALVLIGLATTGHRRPVRRR
jgi:LPXTG-motif cell wall-anchored protein